ATGESAAVGGRRAPPPRPPPPAALALQPGQRELDVLAGAQRVGGEVGAGAGVVAGVRPAHLDAVGVAAGRVGDRELRKDRLLAEVFQAELLLTAELPPQFDLPRLQRHAVGLVQARQLDAWLLPAC